MNPKRQCQRTEPHAPHEWYAPAKIGCMVHECTADSHIPHYYQCEGVNFVEFKVGDKVKLEGVVIGVNRYDPNTWFVNIKTKDGSAIELRDSRLELVERPEPPLPDWLTSVETGKVVTVNGVVYVSVDNWWRSMNNHVIYLRQMSQYYRDGKVKRLVPEA